MQKGEIAPNAPLDPPLQMIAQVLYLSWLELCVNYD